MTPARTANGMPGHPPARGLHRYLFECIVRDLANSSDLPFDVEPEQTSATDDHASAIFSAGGRKFRLTVAPMEAPGEVVVLHRKGG